jgi:peptide/nickel transport system substrate-binding protein
MERNPYFWMIDTAGNQLPYFDYLRVDVAGDVELYNLKVTAGETDAALWFPDFANMELFKANELFGNYQTILAKDMSGVGGSLTFNVSYVEDMAVGDLMRDLDFRRAVSLGMDRDKWNEVLCFGLCEAHPAAPLKGMPWWSDSFMDEYYAYDPERANEMLDGLGLDQRDSEGYRLMENGERLALTLTSGYASTNSWAELFTQDMKEIGIEIIYNLLEPVAQEEALTSNQTHLMAGGVGRITLFGRGTPDNWALQISDRSRHFWGPGYLQWMATNGEEGVEPSEDLLEQMAKWDIFTQLPADSSEAAEFGTDYFQWFADNLYMVGGHGLGLKPFIIHNTIGGFPKDVDLYFGSDNNFFHPYYPELWFRK